MLSPPCLLKQPSLTMVKRVWPAVIASLLVGCAAPQPLSIQPDAIAPEQWSSAQGMQLDAHDSAKGLDAEAQMANFFGLHTPQLLTLVQEALAHSHTLASAREKMLQSELAMRIAKADRFPTVGLTSGIDRVEDSGNTVSLSANASWSVDIWGELSASQKQAQLEYAAAVATFNQEQITLIADVYRQWFQLQEAQLLVDLYKERSQSLQSDLEVIESGYLNGLYEALDLYLARNDANAQVAALAEQEQVLKETQRSLEQLLGRYPDAAIGADEALPLIPMMSDVPLPASIIKQRPDLQANWLTLLATDQALAAAHRARFPSLTLTGSYGGSSDALSNLVSSNLAWSVGASLAATIFDAGQREANQSIKASQRREQEQVYLDAVYTAFTEVENALTAESSLRKQYTLYIEAQDNAKQAESLSFERYQRGLEDYNTVLEAQRRSLDAQTNILSLRRALLQNRVDLMVALGGQLDPSLTVEYTPVNTSQVEIPHS
ncbi:efflux transporter outer membrane subunit [Neptunomonas sp. CHC150]|uniref:efflux transporter outer membrane subunit n=1 Tax=Neptunomonas sp. CHC150 TaxID=2998324 RepID=UPI0025B13440|nr:efflux transporter outer membrane subunit [Neptunomonas sp. CHC150]MDN2659502.1 efflux transporter outer membrane subunit [Neptunomonas sp. CHC150]